MNALRVGMGFDVHAFTEGRPLVLGGVTIPFRLGLAGHSDADVLVHSIIDALLGPAGLGDIGALFPDTDPRYKGISSLSLLSQVYGMLTERNIKVINIDTVLACQEPKISPYTMRMKEVLSAAMGGLDVSRIGIKGKTTEKLGFTGRGEGIAAWAVAMLDLGQ
jgi:2-C-methyl-D-erythritol 2,4-cyclodiphosphate synthase